MKKITTFLIPLLFSLSVHAEPELKGSAPELTQFLNGVAKAADIVGHAELSLAADRAVVTLKVVTENRSMQGALKANHDVRGKLLVFLKDEGISAEHIETSKFFSTPKYGWSSEKPKSYRVENFIKITVQDEKEFLSVSGAMDSWNEVQYVGAEFVQATKDELKKRVLAMACDNVLERRKIYEEKFGVRLVPKSLTDGHFAERNAQNANLVTASGGTMLSSGMITSGLREPESNMEEIASPFGELKFTAEVTVEFSVEQK